MDSDERPWGSWYVLDERPGYKVKRIEVRPRRAAVVPDARPPGRALDRRDAAPPPAGSTVRRSRSRAGESLDIPLGTAHRIANLGDDDLVVIEVQSGDYLGEDDIVRLEDDYGRDASAAHVGAQGGSAGPPGSKPVARSLARSSTLLRGRGASCRPAAYSSVVTGLTSSRSRPASREDLRGDVRPGARLAAVGDVVGAVRRAACRGGAGSARASSSAKVSRPTWSSTTAGLLAAAREVAIVRTKLAPSPTTQLVRSR